MDAAGLGLATVGLCINYGEQLYKICQHYRNADQELRESLLEIEGIWLKTQSQVDTIRDIWCDLGERVQIHQNSVLALLHVKLQLAIVIINELHVAVDDQPTLKSLLGNSGRDIKKLKYAANAKKKLEDVVKDLDQWHKRFDPSWYLLVRAAPSAIDRQKCEGNTGAGKELLIIEQLRRAHRDNKIPVGRSTSVFLSHDCLDQERTQIPNMFAKTGQVAGEAVVIDSLSIPHGNDVQVATKDVRDIARILATVDSSVFSLLKCRGVIQISRSAHVTGFEFIFTLPVGLSTPQSLRTFLLIADRRYPLEGRFHLAKLLARSISFLHSAQIVHKNVSPETILLLKDPKTELDAPFLVGFEKFRRAEGRTYMSGDALWERNLYRHPQRQGERPEEEYRMQHDIYSLGVCLLEIGLGFSFVFLDPASISNRNPTGAVPNPELDISEQLQNKDIRARASQIKQKLVIIAEDFLPGRMGRTYTNVVVSCLTCLDRGNEGFGDVGEFTDEDGIEVGVRYIEKVCIKTLADEIC